MRINIESGEAGMQVQSMPKMHTWGVKRTGFSENNDPKHRGNYWDQAEELHDRKKLSMGKALLKYFLAKYGCIEDVERVPNPKRTDEESRRRLNRARSDRKTRARRRALEQHQERR